MAGAAAADLTAVAETVVAAADLTTPVLAGAAAADLQ